MSDENRPNIGEYSTVKQQASNRVTGWLTDIQINPKIRGIQKLREKFNNSYKKYEHSPKDALSPNLNCVGVKLTQEMRHENKKKNNKVVSPVKRIRRSVRDINISSCSSRMEELSNDIKLSERKTPKPSILITNAEDLFKTETEFEGVEKYERLPSIDLRERKTPEKHEKLPSFDGMLPIFNNLMPRRAPSRTLSTSILPSTGTMSTTGTRVRHRPLLRAISKPGYVITESEANKSDKSSHKPIKTDKSSPKPLKPVSEDKVAELTTEEKRRKILFRFRRIVRVLIVIRVMLKVSRLRTQAEKKSKDFKRFEETNETKKFDRNAFKSSMNSGGFSRLVRASLNKQPHARTDEDAAILLEIMAQLPVFKKYPKSVKMSLAKLMWYDRLNDGRVIVKQDDPGTRMYFVISGEVELLRTDNITTDELITYHIRTLTAGNNFGELALIRNERREFTAVSQGTVELLSFSKDEFNSALRTQFERDCNLRFNFLRNCGIFNDWTSRHLLLLADAAELQEFPNNKVICGDTGELPDRVYFLRRGRCDIIKRVKVVQPRPYVRPNNLLPRVAKYRTTTTSNKPYARDNNRITLSEAKYLTVATIEPGGYFGAGENLRDMFILSRGKTDCLVVDAAQFSILGKSEKLQKMKLERDREIPTSHLLYKQIQVKGKWQEYRQKLLSDILERKKYKHTLTVNEAPPICLPKCFLKPYII